MSAPYVPSVYVPGQQNQQPTNDNPNRSYVPDQQQQPVPTVYGQVYAPGEQNTNNTLQQSAYGYAPGQQQQPAVSQPYVSVQAQPVHQSTSSYGHAYVSGQTPQPQAHANTYTASTQQQQTSAYALGQSVPSNSVPEQQRGEYDPNDPDGDGERGLLATGGKIALGIGAAAVAYQAYNQFQQHQQNQQPQQLAYGGAPQPAFEGGAQQPPFEQPQRRGVLTIYLDRLTDLANKDLLSKSDPYVKLSIEQDNWIRDIDHGKQVSSRKNNDLNPIYNEVFHFNLATLQNMVLSVKVMDDDGGLTSDDKMGSCKIKLWELDLSNFPQSVERVIDRNVFSQHGKCHLRLAYSG